MSNPLIENIIIDIKTSKYQEAMSMISDLFRSDSNNALPHLFLGIICELQYDKAEAMRHYRAALALDGTNKAVIYNLYRLGDGSRDPIRFE